MSYSIEPVTGEQIIVIAFHQDFDFKHELRPLTEDLRAMLDGASEKVILINDLEHISLKLEDLLNAGDMARRREESMFHHPNVLGIAVVSSSKVIQLSARGLNSATFGNLNLPVFATLDEALGYARSQLTHAA